MKNLFVHFVKDDLAAIAIEYGLIASGISIAIIAIVNDIGTNLNAKFNINLHTTEIIELSKSILGLRPPLELFDFGAQGFRRDIRS